jgi:hypothetical protein
METITVANAVKKIFEIERFNIKLNGSPHLKIDISVNKSKCSQNDLTVSQWVAKTFGDKAFPVCVLMADKTVAKPNHRLGSVRASYGKTIKTAVVTTRKARELADKTKKTAIFLKKKEEILDEMMPQHFLDEMHFGLLDFMKSSKELDSEVIALTTTILNRHPNEPLELVISILKVWSSRMKSLTEKIRKA